ncbi:MAG: Ig-like domain-containing protein [Candidatus Thermoplasmatota archaeon]
MKKLLCLGLSFFLLTNVSAIDIDGKMNDWSEKPFERDGIKLYFKLDNKNFYFGWIGSDWEKDGDLFIYFDTIEGGTEIGSDWYGTHSLPFQADYAFCIENSNYWDLRKYDNEWQVVEEKPGETYIGWYDNKNTEISISLAKIEVQNKLRFIAFAQWEEALNVWVSFPIENPANNNGKERFNKFYEIGIDKEAPKINIISPVDKEKIKSKEYIIMANVSDESSVEVDVSINDTFRKMELENGKWKYNWSISNYGIYKITIRAKDKYGNVANLTVTCEYIGGLPKLIIIKPVNNETVKNKNYTIEAKAFSDIGIKEVKIGINGKYENMQSKGNNTYSFLWQNYSNGKYLLNFIAIDKFGKENKTKVEVIVELEIFADLALSDPRLMPMSGNEKTKFNFTVRVIGIPKNVYLVIDGKNYTMNKIDEDIYQCETYLKSGSHRYYFFANNNITMNATDEYSIIVEKVGKIDGKKGGDNICIIVSLTYILPLLIFILLCIGISEFYRKKKGEI